MAIGNNKYQKCFGIEHFIKTYEMLDKVMIIKDLAYEIGFSRTTMNVHVNEMISVGIIKEVYRDNNGRHIVREGQFSNELIVKRLGGLVRDVRAKKKKASYEKEFVKECDSHRRVVFKGELEKRHHEAMREYKNDRKLDIHIGSTWGIV